MQLAWRIICQRWGCLTFSLPNLSLCTCYFLGYLCNYLEDHPYPFPKEQLCSFVRTVCQPKALGNLKNLSMIIVLLHSMPHLWIICRETFIQNLFILQRWFSRGSKGMQELKKVLAGFQLCRSHHRFWQPKLGHRKDVCKVISMSHS